MIPKHIATLAEALQAESMDLDFDLAVQLAYDIAARLRTGGYQIAEIAK